MADADLSSTKARLPNERAPPRGRPDVSTTLFTSLTAGVFLILIGAVAAAAVLFNQGF